MTDQLTETDSHSYAYYFDGYWSDLQSPLTKSLFLVDIRPITFALLMSSYVIFSTKIGPRLMTHRQPFNLRTPMLIYNIVMVTINFFYFVQAINHLNWGRRLLETQFPNTTDPTPEKLHLIWLGYLYWMSKFADLIDTLFFVLRKKHSHISFLHVYHHTSVPTFGWIALKLGALVPGAFLFILLNAFVHTVMYTYYALSAMGPQIQKYLWWKKYLTQLQLIQFAVIGLYGFVFAFFQTGYPQALVYLGLSQPPFFFYMFYDFYQRKYEDEKQKKV